MAYNMYLMQELDNETIVLKLPELPEELKVKRVNNNQSYNVLDLGDIIIPGEKGLKSFSLESYFPADEAETGIQTIERIIDKQASLKKPVRVIINRMNEKRLEYDSNILALIDEFETSEVGGEVGDIYFTMKFTEYRPFSAKVISSA